MKKIVMAFLSIVIFITVYAQDEKKDEERKKGFKKENLFTGGSLTVSFYNGATALGLNPHFGYSLTNWADIALVINWNYQSQRDYQVSGDKLRQTILGPGTFLRVFPVKFLYGQAQFEYNYIKLKYIPADNSGYVPEKLKLEASSLLVGAGYAGGREKGENTYYYFSVMWDLLKETNSPYLDNLGRAIPIIKGGFNIALFQGKKTKYIK